ncbi:hypothetical protein L6261_01150 [Candidatus Parcubacteria bacterium]|nr:hypothetical protein [Candidatus Parcubacteria bacterium]
MNKNNNQFNILEYYLAELVFGAVFIITGILLGVDVVNLKDTFLALTVLVVVFLGVPFIPILFKKFFRK